MDEDRIAQLEKLGMVWSHFDIAWQQSLAAARGWAKEKGHDRGADRGRAAGAVSGVACEQPQAGPDIEGQVLVQDRAGGAVRVDLAPAVRGHPPAWGFSSPLPLRRADLGRPASADRGDARRLDQKCGSSSEPKVYVPSDWVKLGSRRNAISESGLSRMEYCS